MDLFSEFEASFEEPKKETKKAVPLSDIEKSEKFQDAVDRGIIAMPKGFDPNDPPPPFMGYEYKHHSDDDFGTIKVIDSVNYLSMPQGLKEAQELNGVRDHGLGKTMQGDFKWDDNGKIIFKEHPGGAFTVLNPNEITSPIKELLDRKFQGGVYYGTGIDPIYKAPDKTHTIVLNPVMAKEFHSVGLVETGIDEIEIKNNLILIDPHFNLPGFDVDIDANVTPAKVTVTPQEPKKPKFGRMKFKKEKVEGEEDKRKIKANKKEQDGFIFDSGTELYMYNLLKDNGIRFEMKISYTLQEGFVYRYDNIQPMKVTPDFILTDYPIIVDTKGFANERSPMQYKMLKYVFYKEGKEINILMPSNQKQCRAVIDGILNGFKLEEPLSEHAATARKNKLKKLKFDWQDGYWVKGEAKYLAAWIMQLTKFDFEELLLRHAPKLYVHP